MQHAVVVEPCDDMRKTLAARLVKTGSALCPGGQDVVMILQAPKMTLCGQQLADLMFSTMWRVSCKPWLQLWVKFCLHTLFAGQAHEEEMKSLKDSHTDLRTRHSAKDQHHATMQQRVDYLEKMMGDSADKHAAHMKQLEELRRSHDDSQGRHANAVDKLDSLRQEKDSLHSRHAGFEERLMNLERFMSESFDKHARELSEHRNAHGRNTSDTQALREKHASVEERLKFLEQTVGDSVERHAQELMQAKLQLESLHGKLSDEQGFRESREQRHATLEERMRFLEHAIGDSADKHSRELRAHKESREQQHASLEACPWIHRSSVDGT